MTAPRWVVRLVPVISDGVGAEEQHMDVDGFERWLRDRDRADIEWLIDALAATTETADGEVERLRASREVVRRVRQSGRRRQAHEAQHRVHVCALAVCADTGVLDRDRAGTVQVVRAAGEAATALVVGEDEPCCELLIRPFFGTMVNRTEDAVALRSRT